MSTAITMKHPVRHLLALASALLLVAPASALGAGHAPGHHGKHARKHHGNQHAERHAKQRAKRHRTHASKHHGEPASSRATAWTVEDPSFPFRWDGCESIPYRVNLGGTSGRNLGLVKAAVAQIADATGFTFTYAGATTTVPFHKGRGALEQVPDDGLYVAWSTAAAVPSLSGNVVGLGGPGVSYRRIGTQWQVHSGGVVIDKSARLSTGRGNGPTLMSLLLHELGHAMGLGHSRSKANVMYEGLGSWSRPYLGPGDLAGLHDLGGCRAS